MTRRAWAYFLAVTVLWGIPYFFIKVALHDLSPSVVVFVRVAIGALVLLPIALATGGFGQLRGRLLAVAGFGLLEIFIPFTLIALGEQRISSSLTGILIATEPMFISVLALRFDSTERAGRRQLGGMVVGLLGVVVLLGLSSQGSGWVAGGAMVLIATASYAAGALLIKNFLSDVPPIAVAAAAQCGCACLLAVPALFALPDSIPSGGTVASLLILGVACTGVAFIAFFRLIVMAGARRATFITYTSPVIAVALGVIAAGDRFTVATAAGLVIILTGSLLGTSTAGRADRAAAPHDARAAAV